MKITEVRLKWLDFVEFAMSYEQKLEHNFTSREKDLVALVSCFEGVKMENGFRQLLERKFLLLITKIHRDFPFLKAWRSRGRRRASGRAKSILGHDLLSGKVVNHWGNRLGSDSLENQDKLNGIVWTLWIQGFDKAPPLVKFWQEELRKSGGLDVKSMDLEQVMWGSKIQPELLQMYESGILSPTKLSDMIRLLLLYEHGGVWLDSTVLVSDPSFLEDLSSIGKNSVFMASYKHHESNAAGTHIGGSWVLASSPRSHWTSHMIQCFEILLRKTNGGIHYFDFFHVAALLDYYCEECRRCMVSDPTGGRNYYLLHDALYQGNFKMAEKAWSLAPIHKMSYKTFLFEEYHQTFLKNLNSNTWFW